MENEYVKVEDCHEVSRKIQQKLDSIDRRLFRDNGTESMQTKVNRNTDLSNGVRRLFWIILTATLTQLVGVTILIIHKATR